MVNSEYRCPSCREPVQHFNKAQKTNKGTIGVQHAPTCQLFKELRSKYPALVSRIEQERSAA